MACRYLALAHKAPDRSGARNVSQSSIKRTQLCDEKPTLRRLCRRGTHVGGSEPSRPQRNHQTILKLLGGANLPCRIVDELAHEPHLACSAALSNIHYYTGTSSTSWRLRAARQLSPRTVGAESRTCRAAWRTKTVGRTTQFSDIFGTRRNGNPLFDLAAECRCPSSTSIAFKWPIQLFSRAMM